MDVNEAGLVTLREHFEVETGLCPAGIRDVRGGFLGLKVSIIDILPCMLVLPSLTSPTVFTLCSGNGIFT